MDIPDNLAAVIYTAQPYTSFTSSNIKSFVYHHDADTLIVDFHGGRSYAYSNVPPEVVVGLCQAASKGRFFHHVIRLNYNFQRL